VTTRQVQTEIAVARAADNRDLFARLDPADRATLARILRTLTGE
jgi:hypothetical protein